MKKILSLILSLLMVFSLIPMAVVSAEDGEETPVYAHVNIFDASSEDALSIASSKSSVTTSIEAYSTADGDRDVLRVKRTGKYNGCSVGFVGDWSDLLGDAVGIRFWMAGDPETFAKNSAIALGFVSSTKVNYKTATEHKGNWVPTAEGAVYEYYWTNTANTLWKFEGALDSGYSSAGKAYQLMTKEYLESITQIRIGVDAYSASEPYLPLYYIDDIELIKPFKVKIEGEVVGSGAGGQKITLPEAPDGVIAYTDGKNLYYPGEEFVIPGDVELTYVTTIIGEDDEHDFVFDTADKTYTGGEICPAVSSATLEEGVDYTVDYENNVKAGTATIYVRGTGSCFIDVKETFTITKKTFDVSDFMFTVDGLTYTGEALEPGITSSIFADDDYTVTYQNNVNAGDNALAIIEATDKNGYGTVEIPFSIAQKEITADMFTIDKANKVFENKEITPAVTSETLGFSTDYTVGYSNNINVGTANIFIEGIGNYCGRIEETFSITQKEITADMFTVNIDDKVYTANEITTGITSVLTENDYEVAYTNNVDTGVATATITGIGNYAGTLTYNFNITAKPIEETDFVFDLGAKDYTGKEICPSVTSEILKEGDFTVAYANNVDAGTATITITGVGNCTGEIVKTFTINKKTITAEDFEIDLAEKEYKNEEICPEITSSLTEGVDYTVVYSDNVNVGTAKITITACGANCQGEVVLEFAIAQRELKADDFALAQEEFVYSGAANTPAVTSTLKDGDYTVVYADNTNVGTGKVVITGKDNCKGEVVLEFAITPKEVETEWFALKEETVTFTGSQIEVEVVSELVKDADFTVAYTNNVNTGTATVTVTGIGNYKGEVSYTFFIDRKTIEAEWFTVDTENKTFVNGEIRPAVTSVLLGEGEYTVEYANNTNVGTATITVTGQGNYTGQVTFEFAITPDTLTPASFFVNTAVSYTYDGTEKTLDFVSLFEENVDFTVSYENNVNAGTATLVFTGIGNYQGEVRYDFTIAKKAISKSDFSVSTASVTYNGKARTKTIKSKNSLLTSSDYTVSYKNNTKAGTATITIKGKGNFAGQVTYTFKIVQKAISKSYISVSTAKMTYTGKALKKTVKSKNKLLTKKDFSVSYKNNTKVGTATITIKAKGNFKGSLKYTFKIVKPTVKATSKLTVKAASKKMTVSYKKVSGAKGYVIEYALKKNFKGKKTVYVSSKTAKKVIKGLKSGKKYYVRVAAYKNYKKNGSSKTYKSIGKYKTKTVKVK